MILVAGDLLNVVKIVASKDEPRQCMALADIHQSTGGQAVRTAAWLTHSNTPTRVFAKVGARDGSRHADALRGYGIDPFLAVGRDVATGTIASVTDSTLDAGRAVYGTPIATEDFTSSDIPEDLFEGAQWLHLSGFWFYHPNSRAVARKLIEIAKEVGIGTSVDPGSNVLLRGASAAAFISWTQGVDLVFPNLDETRALVGASGPFIDFEALGSAYPEAAVKLGSMGAAYVGRGAREQVAAARVDAVDRAGVGDAFAAGFLSARLAGEKPEVCLAQGNALAQICLQSQGALP
ncbi:MAG: hypothetical protein E6Q27_01690 [Aeromicrobium sp.]|nr:MAG: hypothetical protein E6Q27_01690 [Aeromicrobium sp.]